MVEMLTTARCSPHEDGFRLVVAPLEPFQKVRLEFLDGADADIEVVLESPVRAPGRSNWAERDADGRPVTALQAPDDVGMRRLTVYASLDPMTECSFIIRDASSGGRGLTYLSYVSISVTGTDGEERRLGFLRMQ